MKDRGFGGVVIHGRSPLRWCLFTVLTNICCGTLLFFTHRLKKNLTVFLAALAFLFFALPAGAFKTHYQYDVMLLKQFKGNSYADPLILEKAWTRESKYLPHIERIQVRAGAGVVVAFSPARVTTIPFCFGLHSCWVFLWKTVYPFPAIYKLNPRPEAWIGHPAPPMKYSRQAPAGRGFDNKTNVLFGAFGVVLLLKEKAAFLMCSVLFTIVLVLQITRYRDLPEFKKEWIRRIFFLLFAPSPLPIPVEPYMITAALIFFTASLGVIYAGVPLVVSVFVIFTTFFLCAMRLARYKLLHAGTASAKTVNDSKEKPMSEDNIVLLETKGGVATVTLNRPEVHNAFDERMIERLAQIWDELAARADIEAVVLKGSGKSFSAGADMNWMKRAAGYSREENYADALKLARMLYKLYTLPQVTIACVFGAAMGGGMGLVSCCDVVIADKEAKFALSEVKLGLIPATIGPYVIRALGERQARRFFQTGERFNGETAYRINFVHELAERPEDVEYLLHRILQETAKNGPLAMKAAKQLCLDLAGRALDPELLADTASRIADIRAGEEAKEGLSAFLDKRKAAWARDWR